MPFGNRLREDALRESRNRQDQTEALAKAVRDFTEGIGIIQTHNLPGEKSKRLPVASSKDWSQGGALLREFCFVKLLSSLRSIEPPTT
jgi:hypothetical protein